MRIHGGGVRQGRVVGLGGAHSDAGRARRAELILSSGHPPAAFVGASLYQCRSPDDNDLSLNPLTTVIFYPTGHSSLALRSPLHSSMWHLGRGHCHTSTFAIDAVALHMYDLHLHRALRLSRIPPTPDGSGTPRSDSLLVLPPSTLLPGATDPIPGPNSARHQTNSPSTGVHLAEVPDLPSRRNRASHLPGMSR